MSIENLRILDRLESCRLGMIDGLLKSFEGTAISDELWERAGKEREWALSLDKRLNERSLLIADSVKTLDTFRTVSQRLGEPYQQLKDAVSESIVELDQRFDGLSAKAKLIVGFAEQLKTIKEMFELFSVSSNKDKQRDNGFSMLELVPKFF